ncbi:MAG: sigma-54-dependent Fis family transcriptional regulator [Proteobacteria bacterium]|nr:MAG: sigma-54-dependent Fis family transcriptional regulator [Pseudomonadota bacterium]QKK10550.1 MAG: sigma 54-interacting transcriptional regulator [Pseudomonadota bacterium]
MEIKTPKPEASEISSIAALREEALRTFSRSFDEYFEYSITVDREARVTWISEPYYRFLDLHESPVGKPIVAIIPNSYMPEVVRTGVPVFLDLLHVRDQWVVVSAFPLTAEDGVVIGSFGFVVLGQMNRLKPLLGKFSGLQEKLRAAQQELRKRRAPRYQLSQVVGQSEKIWSIKKQIRQAARFDMPVLLMGETGTGKELFAHSLHAVSTRVDGPFITVNVAAVPAALLEAEFFGVAPGAYTGADRRGREGKFKLADGGTLFLDEIGDMPLELQAKLLRVLQEGELERLGSNQLEYIDVRVVAATSKDLSALIEQGRFRADLYYRLSGFPVSLPALRERVEDIEFLCEKFLEEMSARFGGQQKELSAEALELIKGHQWPGNVRELHNVIERLCVMEEGHYIDVDRVIEVLPDLQTRQPLPVTTRARPRAVDPATLKLAGRVAQVEREVILEALDVAGGKRVQAARLLGISRATLYQRLERMGIEKKRR